jgi:acetyl esterase/lipase
VGGVLNVSFKRSFNEESTMTFRTNLDPELEQALAFFESAGLDDIRLETIPALRAQAGAIFEEMRSQIPENDRVKVEDRSVPGPPDAPAITLRIYRPLAGEGQLPGFYWIHGGGMILGNISQDDAACATYAEQLDCVVVSVEYRLAPEHPHPAPVEDCYAGLRWMAEHAAELGIDPQRIAVGGASAGGGLAAATALLARDRSGPEIAFQCLIYPMLDDRNETPSSREFDGIPTWGRTANITGWKALLGDAVGTAEVSPHAAPARAADLSRLPPALIQVGELEVFRDEDIAYATRMLQAGVPVELHVYPGAFHGWDSAAPSAGVSRRMIADRMGALRRALHRP